VSQAPRTGRLSFSRRKQKMDELSSCGAEECCAGLGDLVVRLLLCTSSLSKLAKGCFLARLEAIVSSRPLGTGWRWAHL